MSSFGFVSGRFGGLKTEQTQNGKTINSFTVEFHSPGKDGQMIPQLVSVKAFAQKAIEKLQDIPAGARVECQLAIGGRAGNDGRVWNDITLDYDKVVMVGAPKGQAAKPQQPAPRQFPPEDRPAPKNTVADDGTVEGIPEDCPF